MRRKYFKEEIVGAAFVCPRIGIQRLDLAYRYRTFVMHNTRKSSRLDDEILPFEERICFAELDTAAAAAAAEKLEH
jgi:hypothetical protein